MQYGAYRRWKLAEDSNLDSKGKPKKKKSKSSTGYKVGDYKVDGANGGEAIGSKDVGGKKKKNKGGSLNADSFYDAIKKFGSGAKVSQGGADLRLDLFVVLSKRVPSKFYIRCPSSVTMSVTSAQWPGLRLVLTYSLEHPYNTDVCAHILQDGATGGTGTAEPPSNKNPIQPKKAL